MVSSGWTNIFIEGTRPAEQDEQDRPDGVFVVAQNVSEFQLLVGWLRMLPPNCLRSKKTAS